MRRNVVCPNCLEVINFDDNHLLDKKKDDKCSKCGCILNGKKEEIFDATYKYFKLLIKEYSNVQGMAGKKDVREAALYCAKYLNKYNKDELLLWFSKVYTKTKKKEPTDFISNGLLKEQYQIYSMYYWLWSKQLVEFEKKYFSTQRKTDMLEWFDEYFATQSNRGGEMKPGTINDYLVDMMKLADEKPDESVYNIKVFCENADNRVLNLEVFYNKIINNDYFEKIRHTFEVDFDDSKGVKGQWDEGMKQVAKDIANDRRSYANLKDKSNCVCPADVYRLEFDMSETNLSFKKFRRYILWVTKGEFARKR